MPERPSGHVPSQARALIQEAKRRGPRAALGLLESARALPDPYFQADVLFFLSANPTLALDKAQALGIEAVSAAGRVEQDWRRAEIISDIARRLTGWREGDAGTRVDAARRAIADALVDQVLTLAPGQGLSDAIQGVGARIGPRSPHLKTLLSRALDHAGFGLDDAKALMRSWARDLGERLGAAELDEIVRVVDAAPDAGLRAHVLGYIHLQAHKVSNGRAGPRAFDAAVAAALEAGDDARVDALRYLASVAATEAELSRLHDAVPALLDAEMRVRLLSTLGGYADKRGLRELGKAWLDEGARAAEGIENSAMRAVTRANLARGFARSKERTQARELVAAARADVEAVEDAAERLRVSHRVRTSAEAVGVELPEDWPPGVKEVVEAKAAPAGVPRAPRDAPRDALVLVGAYEGGFTPAHVRAVARAAPLCDAFNLDLVLVGFPAEGAPDIAERVAKDTNVGGGGRHVLALANAGAMRLAPENVEWASIAEVVVATTSRPDPRKSITMEQAVEAARSVGERGRVALVMGLGKQGLPNNVLDAASHHLELTGARVSFETAVAMGVMAERLRAAREHASIAKESPES